MKIIKKILIVLIILTLVGCGNGNFFNRDEPFPDAGNQEFNLSHEFYNILKDNDSIFYQLNSDNILFQVAKQYYVYTISSKTYFPIALNFDDDSELIYVDAENNTMIYSKNSQVFLSDFNGNVIKSLSDQGYGIFFQGYIICPSQSSTDQVYTRIYDLNLNLIHQYDNMKSYFATNDINEEVGLIGYDYSKGNLYGFSNGEMKLYASDIIGDISSVTYINDRYLFFTEDGEKTYLYYYYRGIKLLPDVESDTSVSFQSEDGDFLIKYSNNHYLLYNTVASQIAKRTLDSNMALYDAINSYYVQTNDYTFVHYSLFGFKLKTYLIPKGTYNTQSLMNFEGQTLLITDKIDGNSTDKEIYWFTDGEVIRISGYFYNRNTDTISIVDEDKETVQYYQNMKKVLTLENSEIANAFSVIQNKGVIVYKNDSTCDYYDFKGNLIDTGSILSSNGYLFNEPFLISYARHLVLTDEDTLKVRLN